MLLVMLISECQWTPFLWVHASLELQASPASEKFSTLKYFHIAPHISQGLNTEIPQEKKRAPRATQKNKMSGPFKIRPNLV